MLAEIEARLAAQVPDLKMVKGAIEFEAAAKTPPQLSKQPAAFVIPVTDRAGPNKMQNAIRQNVTERFGVVLALGNLKDDRGGTATQQMEAVRNSVRTALLGWSPETDYSPVEYAQGRSIGFRNAIVWWHMEFTTEYLIRD